MRAGRQPSRLQAYAALVTLPLLLALDWADDIFNAIGVPNVPGVGFVKNAIRFVGNLILGLIHLAISVLKPIIGDAWSTITHAADLAATGLYNLAGKAEHWVTQLAGTAYGWVLNAIAYGENFVKNAIHDVVQWATDAIHFVGSALDALNRDVIQPLFTFAHEGFDFLWHEVIPGIVAAAKALEHDLTAAIDYVGGIVSSLYDEFVRTVRKWAPVIEKAFGWLVWFALHPFDTAAGLWNQLMHFDPQGFIGSLTGAIDQYGQTLEDWVVRWLGG